MSLQYSSSSYKITFWTFLGISNRKDDSYYLCLENGITWSPYISLHTMPASLTVSEHGGWDRTPETGARNLSWSSENVS